MNRRARFVLAAWLCAAGCKIEDVEAAPEVELVDAPELTYLSQPAQEQIDEETSLVEAALRRQLGLLTSAVLQGRRPGTEGAALTASHIERSMQGIGLSPAGVGGGWRQPVVVRIRATEDALVELPPATEEAEPVMLRHGVDVVISHSGGAGVVGAAANLVDGGWGLEYEELDVNGKMVFVRAGVPPVEGASPEDGTVAVKLARAQEAGAVGCLIATGALQSDPAWEAAVAAGRRARVEAGGTGDRAAAPPFVARLSAEAEASLQAWLGAVSAIEGASTEVKTSVTTTERTVVDPNVIGRIAGITRPTEVVLVVSHWDAGGTAAPLPGGGATIDNATGVAALLATARKSTDWVRRGRQPDRSLVFVATASDTLELAGTHTLLAGGPLSGSEIVAVVDLDTLALAPDAPELATVGAPPESLGPLLGRYRPGTRIVAVPPGGRDGCAEKGPACMTLTRFDPEAPAADGEPDVGGPITPLADDVRLVFDLIWALAEAG